MSSIPPPQESYYGGVCLPNPETILTGGPYLSTEVGHSRLSRDFDDDSSSSGRRLIALAWPSRRVTMAASVGAESERWNVVLIVVERDGSLVLVVEPTRVAVPCPTVW